MATRDGNGRTGAALAEGPEELWPVPGSVEAEPRDWRSLYERGRSEELRWAEVRAPSHAGS